MAYFRWWPMLPAIGLLRPVAEISVNSIVHLTLIPLLCLDSWMFFLAMFWYRRFLILSLWRFRKDNAKSSPVKFSLNIYMFVPSLSNSLLTVIRKSMLLNGNPHSETVNKCSIISHSASFERTVGWPGSLLIISPFFSLMKFWKRERAIEYFNLAQATRWEETFWYSSNAFLNVSWAVSVNSSANFSLVISRHNYTHRQCTNV